MYVTTTKVTYTNEKEEEIGSFYMLDCSFQSGVSERRKMKCDDCGKQYKNYWALNWKQGMKGRVCPECFLLRHGIAPKIVTASQYMSLVNEWQFETQEEATQALYETVGGREEKEGKNGYKHKPVLERPIK